MNVSVEDWTALRAVILTTIGDLATRAEIDDPAETLEQIANAIDTLTLCNHPFEQGGTMQ